MATRLLGIGSTLVLVRLLSPADFGLVAMAMAFATALEVCTEIGVEDQIIRTPDPQPALYHTAFTLNLIRAVGVGVMVILLAGPAAGFLEEPRLEPVLVVLGLVTAASGLANIAVVDFRRDMVFEREFRLLLLPRLAGIATTITCALLIPGEWALVAGIAVGRLGRVVASYAMHPFRPHLSFSDWRALAGVSFWSWAIGVTGMLRDRADTFVIGRVLGPAKLGIYSAGVEIATLPATELVEPVCRVCLPGFAATAREGANLGDAYRRIVGLTALFGLPAGVGISLVANDLIMLAYGPAWMDAAPVVMVIGLVAAISPLGAIGQALLGAQTMLRTIFVVFAVTMVLRVSLLLALTGPYGLLGAALAAVLTGVVEHGMLVGLTLRRLGLQVSALLPDIWRPFLGGTAMALLLWGLALGWAPPPPNGWVATRDLLLAVPLGAACYVGTVGLLWGLAGRPEGSAERDVLAVAGRGIGGLLARLRPAGPLAKRG